MLKFFEIEKTYHKLTVRLYVDCAARLATQTITYDRRIVDTQDLGIDQCCEFFGHKEWLRLTEPAQAIRFLSRDEDEHGNFMEKTEKWLRMKTAA